MIDSLELRCDELQAKVEQYKIDETKRKKSEKRTWSVPNLTKSSPYSKVFGNDEFLGFPASDSVWHKNKQHASDNEIKELRETVKILKVQLGTAHRKREELDNEVAQLENINKSMTERIEDFERFQEETRNDSFQQELEELKKGPQEEVEGLCKECGGMLKMPIAAGVTREELIEHDIEEIPGGQMMRLKNGGSAYGSRESLNMIGLETITPTLESCGEILAAAARETAEEMDNLSKQCDDSEQFVPARKKEVSLLGELEEQYRSLVKKYENLIEAKTKRSLAKEAFTQDNLDIATIATPRDPKGRPMSLYMPRDAAPAPNPNWRKSACLDLTSPADPTDGHFSQGPPEYKKLFREIFETLKRSYSCAEDLNKLGTDDSESASSFGGGLGSHHFG